MQDVQGRVLGFTSRVFICSGTPFIHSLSSVSSSTLFGFSYKLRLMVRNWSEIWREGVQPTRVNQRMEPAIGFYYEDQKNCPCLTYPVHLFVNTLSEQLQQGVRKSFAFTRQVLFDSFDADLERADYDGVGQSIVQTLLLQKMFLNC